MTEETPQYDYPTKKWDKVKDALILAKCVGVLARCTCDESILDWRGGLCGYCQVEESIVMLAELRARSEKQLEACREAHEWLEHHGGDPVEDDGLARLLALLLGETFLDHQAEE